MKLPIFAFTPSRFTPSRNLFLACCITLACADLAQAAPAKESVELEQALTKLLQERPELVREALNTLEQRESTNRALREKQLIVQLSNAINAETGSTVLGNPNGDVTLVEFIDYHCGYCKQLSANVEALIAKDPQLRVLVKHLPILGEESAQAAQLMLGVSPGAKAQQVHKALMGASKLDSATLHAIETQFQLSRSPQAVTNKGLAEVQVLADQLGIQGTPAIVLGEALFRGAPDLSSLEALIQAQRQQLKTKSKPLASF